MFSLPHVTNSIIKRANDTDVPLTQMKLQKLLYFFYKSYLQRTGQPLFSERFEPWQYGPVLSDVYEAFRKYRGNPIKSYYPDPDGSSNYVSGMPGGDFQCSLDDTWTKYAQYSGLQLSNFTHRENGAWHNAVNKNAHVLSDMDIQNEPDIEVC